MIQFEDEVLFDALTEENSIAVRPDELGLLRFARSVRDVFYNGWSGFDAWRLQPEDRVNWSLCCDSDTQTIWVPDLIFADRDALRAFLIVACTLASGTESSNDAMSFTLADKRDLADSMFRHRLADYLDDVIHGIRNGDVAFEHGTHIWVFTSLEWVRPAEDANGESAYDKLFEDSLMFSELKRMLEREEA